MFIAEVIKFFSSFNVFIINGSNTPLNSTPMVKRNTDVYWRFGSMFIATTFGFAVTRRLVSRMQYISVRMPDGTIVRGIRSFNGSSIEQVLFIAGETVSACAFGFGCASVDYDMHKNKVGIAKAVTEHLSTEASDDIFGSKKE
jgi:hypothetical protein